MQPTSLEELLFCQQFIALNPSFKQYVITMGMYKGYQQKPQLHQFYTQLQANRSVLAIGFLSLSFFYHNSSPNLN